MLKLIKLFLFMSIISGNNIFTSEGQVIPSTEDLRTCPTSVDSCVYVCDNGTNNPCHPENIFTISIDTTDGNESTQGSRYRIFFPWEYNGKTANKFRVTASWPCLRPSAVYASGNYAYWDIFGNDECPGTVQGSIWYGDNCQDEDGNIGSDDCEELIGRFCFAAGDTLNWDLSVDQSISNDICDACWMSEPAWSYYDSLMYSSSDLSPQNCQAYDHCHHSASDDILCGIGYLDEMDSSTVLINEDIILNDYMIENYPNPFNPATQITYALPEADLVSINIYDITGRMVKSLVNTSKDAGYHSLRWDATNNIGEGVSAGMYIYTIQAGEYRATKKMVLLK